jgi:histone-lysine N-methyltransferase SETD3
MPNIVAALHLIDEYCKPDSFWRPYVRCLPSRYDTALYLSDADVNQLKGSQALEEVVKLKRSIARQYAYFTNQMHTNDKAMRLEFKHFFTYELYR